MMLRRHEWEFPLRLILALTVFLLLSQRSLTQDSIDYARSSSSERTANARMDLPSPQGIDNTAPWVIRKRVDEVTVFFTVTQGRTSINDLSEEEIRITDDRKPPSRISAFGHQTDLPLHLGLLVDASDSVQYRFDFEKDAASRFVRDILRPGMDEAFVIKFSSQSSLGQDYTDDPEQLARGISSVTLGGETAMYDAIQNACEKLAAVSESEPTGRILVLLTDGDDNSSKSTLNQVIATAQRTEVTIYAVSTDNHHLLEPQGKILNNLTLQTGGSAFFPSGARDTERSFTAIEQDMRSRYVVSYQPRDLVLDGHFRRIQIIAKRMRKKFHVRAREGYYTPLLAQSP